MRSASKFYRYMSTDGAIRLFDSLGIRFTQSDELYKNHCNFMDKSLRDLSGIVLFDREG